MSDLTDKFTALETQLSDQQTALLTELDTINFNVGGIGEQIVVLNNSMQSLLRQAIAAIGQSTVCQPCPTPSLTVPPIDTTPHAFDVDKCKRVEAFLSMLSTIADALDNLIVLDVPAAWTLLSDLYAQTIATLGASDTIPLPSFPEAVNLAGNYFSFAAGHLFSGETVSGDLSPLLGDLKSAMFAAVDPSSAESAYNGVIDASSITNEGKLLLKSIAYNELWSYWLDPTTMPDLSGFAGDDCGLGPCMTFTTDEMDFITGEFGPAYIPHWAKYGITPVSLPGQDFPVWIFGGYGLYTWDNTGYTTVYHQAEHDAPDATFDETGQFVTWPIDNWYVIYSPSEPFALTFCPG